MFEEGLWIPICKLMRKGERNDDVWKFILSNVRQPDHMAGDLHAQIASGEVGARRLKALCDAHALADIEELSDEIINRSEQATRESIRALPSGTYRGAATLDLADGSLIEICCAITVDAAAGEITVDYEGSSGASPFGINVVKNYTHAYTTFTVRSVLNPEVPNNHGSLSPIKVVAPEGSIVNAVSPAPCTARHVVGMFLPNALLKALAQLRPEQAMAEGSGAVWTMQVSGNHDDGRPFITAMFTYAGGVGARATKPGLSATSYPTGVAGSADRGRRGIGTGAVPAEVAARRIRRSRRARGWPGADDRVHGRRDEAVATQRGDVAVVGPARWHLRRRGGRRGPLRRERIAHHDPGARDVAARRCRAPRSARRRRVRQHDEAARATQSEAGDKSGNTGQRWRRWALADGGLARRDALRSSVATRGGVEG